MSEDKIMITRKGFDELQRELNEIQTIKRPQVIDRIREARQLGGDLSENSDYDDAKRIQAMLEARITELKAILSHAKIIDEVHNNGCIGIGSVVSVKCLDDNMDEEFTIVGPVESSPADGKISVESCVGEALLGHKAGDIVTIRTPGGVTKYEILTVK